jgi:hypothetical protein
VARKVPFSDGTSHASFANPLSAAHFQNLVFLPKVDIAPSCRSKSDCRQSNGLEYQFARGDVDYFVCGIQQFCLWTIIRRITPRRRLIQRGPTTPRKRR